MANPTTPTSDAVRAGRSRVLAAADAALCVVCLVFLVKAIWLGAAVRIVVLLFAVVASALAWFYIRRGVLATGRYLLFAAFWMAMTVSNLTTGMESSVAMSWFPISVFLAALLGNSRFCLWWVGLICLTVLGFWMSQETISSYDLFWVEENLDVHLRMHVVGQIGMVASISLVWLKTHREIAEKLDERERELDAAHRALRDTEDRATQAEQAKHQFLTSISHEIRTPLNSIVGFSKRLVDHSERLEKRDVEAAVSIHRNGKGILYLFNDLLELADNQSNPMTYSARPFPLEALIKDCIAQVELVAQQYGIALQSMSAQHVAITGDQSRLAQAIASVLYFAVNETKEGAVTVYVTKASHDGIAGGTIAICDTSDGIFPEQIRTLFDSHYHFVLNSNKDLPLSPLSLMLSARLIRQHGGDISATSDLGKGSVFRVWLPCEPIEPRAPSS